MPALTRAGAKGSPRPSFEWTMMSPHAPQRECCPYLFQRGMVVSEEGVRGGQDHLRSEEVSGIIRTARSRIILY